MSQCDVNVFFGLSNFLGLPIQPSFPGFGCMLFTVFCNVSVIYELLAMRRRVGPGLNNATFKEKLEHFKFISIATIVSVAYIGCSTPYLVRSAYLIELLLIKVD